MISQSFFGLSVAMQIVCASHWSCTLSICMSTSQSRLCQQQGAQKSFNVQNSTSMKKVRLKLQPVKFNFHVESMLKASIDSFNYNLNG
uniref:Secreted protein n=1 Tax=Romanomermis culicivorax TaxID=13658 RepID=A0A915HI67_ROMCU